MSKVTPASESMQILRTDSRLAVYSEPPKQPTLAFADATTPQSGTVILFTTSGHSLGKHGKALNKATEGRLKTGLDVYDFLARPGEVVELAAPSKDLRRIIVVGTGNPLTNTQLTLERAGGAAWQALLRDPKLNRASLVFDTPSPKEVGMIAAGFERSTYTFNMKSGNMKSGKPKKPDLINITAHYARTTAASTAYNELAAETAALRLTQDLVNGPGNLVTPASFVEECRFLERHGIKLTVLDETEIQAKGMGALWAVGKGSINPPRLMIMEWRGSPKATRPIALVGKGVTFDTGGISLKPAGGMQDMKMDMGGAAAVVGTLLTAALKKTPINLIGVVALAENMPGPNAYKPGDVITSLSGKTIEIINTDAEGRVVLADALTVAETYNPREVITIATLTGAVSTAIGSTYAGIMGTGRELVHNIMAAGKVTGEQFWELPLGSNFDPGLSSSIADMANQPPGGLGAGSSMGGQFLSRFVTGGRSFAHLDIASVAWKGGMATGHPVRTLNHYLEKN